jgi:hypothetical protein
MQDALLEEEDSSTMPEQRIDMNMLARVDSDQKNTASRVDTLDRSIQGLSREVGEIKGLMRPPTETPWWLRFIIAPICVAVILGTGGAVIHLEIEVGGIKASQTKQILSTITDQAAKLQAEGKTPTQTTIQELTAASKTVASAITSYPQYPEGWQAATSLINLRSLNSTASDIPLDVAAKAGPPIPNQGNCFTMPLPASKVGQIAPSNSVWVVYVPWWHDCTLYLDDVEGFEHSTFKRYIYEKIGSAHDVLVAYDLTLVRVIVVYHGGKIIPATHMIFYDCRFDFDVPTTPFGRGKDLLVAMLAQSFQERTLNITLPKPSTHS